MDSFMEATQVISNPDAQHRFAVPESTRIQSEVVVAILNVDGVEHVIYNRENKIGRSDICDVVIKSKSVSTVHATIDGEDPTNHFICDLNSTNSTKLGSAVLKPRVQYFIKNGETITFANVTGIYNYVERENEKETLPLSDCGDTVEASESSDKKDGSGLMFDTPLKGDGDNYEEMVPSSSPIRGKPEIATSDDIASSSSPIRSKPGIVNPLIFDMATQQFYDGNEASSGSGVSSVFDMLTEQPFPASENVIPSEVEAPVEEFPHNGGSQDSNVATKNCDDVTIVASEPIGPAENFVIDKLEETPKSEEEIKSAQETSPVKPICTFNIVDDPSASNLPNKKRFAKSRVKIFSRNQEETASESPPSVQNEMKVSNTENSDHSFEFPGFETRSTSEENVADEPVKPPGEDILSIATQAVPKCSNENSFIVPTMKRSSFDLCEAETQLVVAKEKLHGNPKEPNEHCAQPQPDSPALEDHLSVMPTQLITTEPDFTRPQATKPEPDEQSESTTCGSFHLNLSEVPTQLVDSSNIKSTPSDSQFPLHLAISEDIVPADTVSVECSISDLPTQAVHRIEKHLEGIAEVERSDDNDDDDDIIPCSQPVAEEKPQTTETSELRSQPAAEEIPQLTENNSCGSSRSSSPVIRTRGKKALPLLATQAEETHSSQGISVEAIEEEDDFCSPVLRTTPKKLLPLPDTQLEEPDELQNLTEIVNESEAAEEETVVEDVLASNTPTVNFSEPKEDTILDSNKLIIEETSNQEIESQKTPRQFVVSDDDDEEICMVTPTRSSSRVTTSSQGPTKLSVKGGAPPRKEDSEGFNVSPTEKLLKTKNASEVEEPSVSSPTSPNRSNSVKASSPTSPASTQESLEAKSDVFEGFKDKPSVKKYYNRNKMGNSFSFLLKEPAATSTPVRYAGFDDSPSGRVYETPEKSPESASKKVVTLFSDTNIPPTNPLKPNGKKSNLSKIHAKESWRSSVSSGDCDKKTSKTSSLVETPMKVIAKSKQKQMDHSSEIKTPKRGRPPKKQRAQQSSTPSKSSNSIEAPQLEIEIPEVNENVLKAGKKLVPTCVAIDSTNTTNTPSISKEITAADAPIRRSTRGKPLEKEVSPQPETPSSPQPSSSRNDSQLSSPNRSGRSPLRYGSQTPSTSLRISEDSQLKVPSRSVTDMSSDSSQDMEFVQKRTRRPPNRIMEDSFQPIPFVPGRRPCPKSPSKVMGSDTSMEANQLRQPKNASQESAQVLQKDRAKPPQELEEPVKRPGRPPKRLFVSRKTPETSLSESVEITEISTASPSKRPRKVLDGGVKEESRGRRGASKLDDTQPTDFLENSEETKEPTKATVRRGKNQGNVDTRSNSQEERGKNKKSEVPQSTVVSLNVLEGPRMRGRRGKAPQSNDSQPSLARELSQENAEEQGSRGIVNQQTESRNPTEGSQNSLPDPETRGRRGKAPRKNASEPVVGSQESQQEPKSRRRLGRDGPLHASQNSQEDYSGTTIRGRRGKASDPDDSQPTFSVSQPTQKLSDPGLIVASQSSQENPRTKRHRGRDEPVQSSQNSQEPEPKGRSHRGKAAHVADDTQPTCSAQNEPETSPRGRGCLNKHKKQVEDTQPASQPETVKGRSGRRAKIPAAAEEESPAVSESQTEPTEVKRSGRVRKKKLPFDELSSEKEKEVMAKKKEKTVGKRGNTNVSVEYDLPPKNPRMGSSKESFATPTSPAVRGDSKKRVRASSSSSLSSIDSSRSTSSGSAKKKKIERVMFTGYSNKSMEALVKKLGGEMVSCPYSCSVLVTDQVRRTVKFLCALSRGVPIVSVKWLNSCRTTNSFTDPDEWLLDDKEAEKKFSFNLRTSLNQAKSVKFLDGWKVYVTPSVKPVPSEMKMIVECSGGKYLTRVPAASSDRSFIVSCIEDRGQWAKLKKTNQPVVSSEAILSGVLQQKLDLQRHLLS